MVNAMRLIPAPQRGFSAIELLVVITIVGILAAFAVPSMRSLMMTQKVRSMAYDLFSDLTYARSEAIARGHNVLVQSAGGNTDWSGGWVVTDVSVNPTQQLKIKSCIGTPCVLTSGVSATGNVANLTFDRSGRWSSAVATKLAFSILSTDSSATTDQKRCVSLDPSGRPRSATGACT